MRRRAEEALSLKTALLEAQMEASIDGIIVLDEKRNPLIMNRRLVEIGGVPEQVLALEDNNAVYDHLSGIVEDPETVMGIFSHLDEHPWEIYRDELKFKDGRVLDRYTAPVTGTEASSMEDMDSGHHRSEGGGGGAEKDRITAESVGEDGGHRKSCGGHSA